MSGPIRMFGKRKVDLSTDFGREFWLDHLENSLKDYDAHIAKAVHALEAAMSAAERMNVDGEHHHAFAQHAWSSLSTTSPDYGDDGEGTQSEWVRLAREQLKKAGRR